MNPIRKKLADRAAFLLGEAIAFERCRLHKSASDVLDRAVLAEAMSQSQDPVGDELDLQRKSAEQEVGFAKLRHEAEAGRMASVSRSLAGAYISCAWTRAAKLNDRLFRSQSAVRYRARELREAERAATLAARRYAAWCQGTLV